MSWLSKQLNSFGLGGVNQVFHPVNDIFKGTSGTFDKYAHMWHVGGKHDLFTPALMGVGGLLAGGSSLWGSAALGSGGAAASSGGLGTGLTEFGPGDLSALGGGTETYSPAMIEATSGGSSTPSWMKLAQGAQGGMGQQQQPQGQFSDPTLEMERRRQRVLELLTQLHQSQQPQTGYLT